MSGTNLFCGARGGVFISTDNGATWAKPEGLPNGDFYALAVAGTNLFAGTQRGGVYLSTNSGASWTPVNVGLTSADVRALAVSGTNLFAGTAGGGGVWRRPLSEMITSVEGLSIDLPTHFSLAQNYPNPFNPSTIIQYALPHRLHVTLAVYNALGQQVAQLVNSDIDAGFHEIQFNATNLASGVYFYRIQAGSFVETKKFLVLR